MALLKERVDENGIISSYHRIANIQQNFINHEPLIEVYVYHYTSENFRNIEKIKIEEDGDYQNVVGFSRYIFELNDSLGATRTDFYNRMKNEIEEYFEAEDV